MKGSMYDLCPQELNSFFLNQPLQLLFFAVLLQPRNQIFMSECQKVRQKPSSFLARSKL